MTAVAVADPGAKYANKGLVARRHCNAAFMKQVLPRLDKPTSPSLEGAAEVVSVLVMVAVVMLLLLVFPLLFLLLLLL
jgi:hypothetical protein